MTDRAAASGDTIAAIATPPGRGAVAIVRVSGAAVPRIGEAMLGRLPSPRRALLADFLDADGMTVDRGLALYFPAPNSYTGEHVLELQGHGGEVVADLVLAAALAAGARPARPGEFSERAYLNGRMDLAQAEAVADLIAAESAAAARAALSSLEGAFSEHVHRLEHMLDALRVQLEAHLDFPDEDIDALPGTELIEGVAGLQQQLDALRRDAAQGALLQGGMRVALVGAPNAGKSSLMNRLLNTERAIVTDQPGTTRDVLEERYAIDGMPLYLIDTAGLRDTDDVAELAGIERTRQALARADRVLLIVDDAAPDALPRLLEQVSDCRDRCTVVRNKVDLTGRPPGLFVPNDRYEIPEVSVSARTGAGLAGLTDHLKALVGFSPGTGVFSARRRHLAALDAVGESLGDARLALAEGLPLELAAEDLRRARAALGSIVGAHSADALLGEIFASFCIGK